MKEFLNEGANANLHEGIFGNISKGYLKESQHKIIDKTLEKNLKKCDKFWDRTRGVISSVITEVIHCAILQGISRRFLKGILANKE